MGSYFNGYCYVAHKLQGEKAKQCCNPCLREVRWSDGPLPSLMDEPILSLISSSSPVPIALCTYDFTTFFTPAVTQTKKVQFCKSCRKIK